MKIDATLPVSRLAADIPGAMAVLELLGIEYSCAGEQSLEDAAHAAGLDPMVVVASLRRLNTMTRDHESWNDRTLIELQKHLVTEHHRFVRDELAVIAMRLSELCTSAAQDPDLHSLRAAFTKLSDVILPHMQNEERNVFPVIEALETAWQSGSASRTPNGEFHATIGRLVAEHGTLTALIRTIRDLRLRLLVSNDAPAGYRRLLESVATLEGHLHEYMFLENCILFPRAIELEKQVANAPASTLTSRPG